MQPGILYYPSDLCFPTADFISVDFQKHKKTNQVFCVQVTSAESYIKMISVHKKLYQQLKMDPQSDEIFIYLVTQLKWVDGYTKNTIKKLISGGTLPHLRFAVVKPTGDWHIC